MIWIWRAIGGMAVVAATWAAWPSLAPLFAGDLAGVQAAVAATGVWAPVISFWLMVIQGVLAPLPAFLITLTNAALFGWLPGAALSWTSALVAAALCFGIARWAGRGAVERFVPAAALTRSDQFFARHGAAAILFARLIPAVPFDVVSYAAGLTTLSWPRFLVATGLGRLPATLAYSYAGATLAGAGLWLFIAAIVGVLVIGAAAAWLKR
jgi:uncharacterized membrane protein YdjX (TVP38/TMEM64 family)